MPLKMNGFETRPAGSSRHRFSGAANSAAKAQTPLADDSNRPKFFPPPDSKSCSRKATTALTRSRPLETVRHLPLLLAMVLTLSMPVGCLDPQRYTYTAIRQEHADQLCRLAPQEPRSADIAACVLQRTLTLDDAIGVARKNNPDGAMASARIRQAEARLLQSAAVFYPTARLYTEYLQGDAPSAYLFKTIDTRKFAPGTDFNNPGWFENYESGLRARMNLYRGGGDRLRREIAAAGVDISRLDLQQVDNALVAAVTKAFYETAAARKYIAIARQSEKTVAAQLRIMQVRYRSGGALKSDILSLEVRLAEAREAVVRSENRLQNAHTALANLLGLAPESELRLELESIEPLPVPSHYREGVERALKDRPELRRSRQQVRQARMAVDVAQAGYWPQVDLVGAYWVDDAEMQYSRDRENWTAALQLNWDIFTGLSTRAEIRAAAAGLDEMLSADRKTRLQVQFEVRSAYLQMSEAKERLRVAETAVAQAEESLSLVQKQYQGGSATITRYLEAELARNTARIRAAAAFYDRETAVAEVARTVGYWGRPAAEGLSTIPEPKSP